MQNSPYSPESTSSSSSSPYSLPNGNSPGIRQTVSPNTNYLVNKVPPYLCIINQPQGKFRFRYVSEMTGTHGCLMAESNDRNKKEYIRVQLTGCQEKEAIVRCTLVTNSANPVPHVHRLGGDGNPNGNEGEHQDIVVSAKNDWVATFSGLTIIHTAKKQVREMVQTRLIREKKGERLNRCQGQQLKDEADKIATTMDLHSVRLKFEAFVERGGIPVAITLPEYSQPIHNLKSTHAGDLRIVRIDKVYSCCTGQEEIFIFVEKVNKKDIKIRFFETDDSGNEIWSAFADFSELDVHHQYAIAFKTPPYQDLNIQSDVTVQFQLYRPSNESTSEPKSFTYTPREIVGFKRPRRQELPNPSLVPKPGSINPSRNSSYNSGLSSHAPGDLSPFSVGNGEASQDSSCAPHLHRHPGTYPTDHVGTFIPNVLGTIDPSSIAWSPPQPPPQPQQISMHTQQNYPLNAGSRHQPTRSIMGSYSNQPGLAKVTRETVSGDSQAYPLPVQPNSMIRRAGPALSSTGVSNNFDWNPSSDEMQMLAFESMIAPTEYGARMDFSEINLEQNDDELLRMLTSNIPEIDDIYPLEAWKPDACGSMPAAVNLTTKPLIEDPLANTRCNRSRRESPSQQKNSVNAAALMSSYSISMTLALRSYAETGDLTHILTRLRHLMAIQSDNGDNALHDALLHNQIDALRAMLKAASSLSNNKEFINSQNNFHATPLHISVMKNLTEATALLLQYGADPNLTDARGNTALHLAASNQHLIDCMQLLLSPHPSRKSSKIKLDLRNYEGFSPLLLAVSGGNVKGVQLLLDHGADVNSFESKRGRSALHLAVEKQEKDIVLLLLKNPNLNVDAESYDGSTALHLAVMDKLDDFCYMLVRFGGADPAAASYVGSLLRSSDHDSDDNTCDSDVDNDVEENEDKGRSPIDLAQYNSKILNILHDSPKLVATDVPSFDEGKLDTSVGSNRIADSGIDLLTSKDLSKVLDDDVINKLSKLLETHNDWEALIRSLDLGESAIGKQQHPAIYLLENLDRYDLTAHYVLEKLRELNIGQAAAVLDEYLHN